MMPPFSNCQIENFQINSSTYLCSMSQDNSIQLSVVIITYNEAANIERCIRSVQTVADEVLVVDSHSTDDTVAICEALSARVILHDFEGHIQQKNYAKAQARYDHVLSLDADEALSTELAASIAEAKQNFTADGYVCNRLNNYCGTWVRHGSWYPDRKLRLWDRRRGEWGGRNPHDRFILGEGTKVKSLKGDLLHYTISSIEQHLQQIDSFSSITAQALFEEGKKASAFHLYLKPYFKFLWSYVIKLGFLDGHHGYVISKNSAHAYFLRYAKLRELWRAQKQAKK